ncbi:MAG: porin [Cardiobacteriaceae bacterium]|nr:porin [Cardiobacteriaceae bacterium]
MKKSLLALALVAGFAQANETTLYGRVLGEGLVIKAPGGKTTGTIHSFARFGIKGNEDLNAGLKAIYQMEFNYRFHTYSPKTDTYGGVNGGTMNEIRQAYVGLKGDFGTLKLGKQSSVHGLFTGKADYSNTFGGWYNDGSNRLSHSISYASPDMGGLTVAVAGVAEGRTEPADRIVKDSDSRSFTAFEVGAQYAANGLEAAVVYTQTDKASGTGKFYAGSLAYNADAYGVAFDYERNTDKDNYYSLAGEYKISEQDRVYAGIEMKDPKDSAAKKQYFAHLGYQHNLSKRTRTWVEIGGQRDSLKVKDVAKSKNGYVATVGLRHDF